MVVKNHLPFEFQPLVRIHVYSYHQGEHILNHPFKKYEESDHVVLLDMSTLMLTTEASKSSYGNNKF